MSERRSRPFRHQIGRQVRRRVLARQRPDRFWRDLGVMGTVGWSVAVPMLAGALLGHWLDARQTSERSWTLALLLAGVVLGCWNAASWLWRERRDLPDREEEGRDG